MARARQTIACILLGSLALVQAGCAAVAVAGAVGAGAAAAGYVYYNGVLYRDYPANLNDTLAAVRTSLLELQFPLMKETADTGTAYFQTQTGDGHAVRVYLDVVPSPIPLEGSVTRVSIRVGLTGDKPVSLRILEQVSRHLIPSGAAPPGGSTTNRLTPIPMAPPGTPGVPPMPTSSLPPTPPPIMPQPIMGVPQPVTAPVPMQTAPPPVAVSPPGR